MAWAGTLVDFKDGVTYTGGANSDTTPSFSLLGGKYALFAHSSGTVSSLLNILAPDASYAPVDSAVTTNFKTYDLPPGTYQIVLGATAGTQSGGLVRVPYRAA